MVTIRIMSLHIGKGRTVSQAISDIIDYVENPEKTDNGRLIIGYACDSRTADRAAQEQEQEKRKEKAQEQSK